MGKRKAPERYVRACHLSQVAASAEAARAGVVGALGLAKAQNIRSGLISALDGAAEVLAHVRDEVFREAFTDLHGAPPRNDQMPAAVHQRKTLAAGK